MSDPKTREITGYVASLIVDRLNRAGGAVQGDDPRLTNARPPTPHHGNHAAGGPDALSPEQIGALPANAVSPDARELLGRDLAGQRALLNVPILPPTVSQAEAEGGQATTPRIWTALRVRQAANAEFTARAAELAHSSEQISDATEDGRALLTVTLAEQQERISNEGLALASLNSAIATIQLCAAILHDR